MTQFNVKKVIPVIGILATLALLSACGSGGLNLNITRGSGNVKTETRQVSGISEVRLNTSGELTLSQGETESLIIEAEDNILPLLTNEVTNGVLKLDTKENSSFSATKPVKYTLVVKNLNALADNGSGSITSLDLNLNNPLTITGNGSGSMTLANIQSGDTQIKLSGSGSLTIASLKSDKVSVDVNGSGDGKITTLTAQSFSANLNGNGSLEVGGTTNDLTVNVLGSGSFSGDQFASKAAVVKTMGSGSANVQANDTLDATINGSGSINYKGNPTVTQKDNGSGSINQKS